MRDCLCLQKVLSLFPSFWKEGFFYALELFLRAVAYLKRWSWSNHFIGVNRQTRKTDHRNKNLSLYDKQYNKNDNNASIWQRKSLLDRRIFVCGFLSGKGGNQIRAPPCLEFEFKNQISNQGGQNGEIRT